MKAPLQPGKSFGSAASVQRINCNSLATIANNRPSAIAQRKLQGAIEIANRSMLHDTQLPIQRVIKFNKAQYPNLWSGIKECSRNMRHEAVEFKKFYLKTRDLSKAEEGKFTLKWNSIARSKRQVRNIADMEDLAAAFDKSYAASKACRAAYDKRQVQEQSIVTSLQGALKKKGTDMQYIPSARNPMLVDKAIKEIEFDKSMPPHQRESRHMSTLILSQYPDGQEVQVSIAKDKRRVCISSNTNNVNAKLDNTLSTIENLKALAAKILKQQDLASKTKSQINGSRNLRHTVKFLDRVDNIVSKNAKIHISKQVDKELDGQHAEIRIEKSDEWNANDYHNPSGTMLPCMGCYLYFNDQKINIGHYHGPMWITNSALSSQLEQALREGKKIGSLGIKHINQVISFLKEQHKLVEDDAQMAHGKAKYKKAGPYDYDADSDSEVDDDCIERVKKKMATLV